MNTVVLENVSNEFLPTLKALAKVANAKFKIDKKTQTASKVKEFYTLKELDEMPLMKKLKKWEEEHPKEATQINKKVDKTMGLI